MVTVTVDSVKAVLKMGSEAPEDNEIDQFIKDAVATALDLHGVTISPASCTTGEFVIVRNMAAVYCWAKQTGLTSSGALFQIGDYTVDTSRMPANIKFLYEQALKFLTANKTIAFRSGASL